MAYSARYLRNLKGFIGEDLVEYIITEVRNGYFLKKEAEKFANNLHPEAFGAFINSEIVYGDEAMELILSKWFERGQLPVITKEAAVRKLISALKEARKDIMAAEIQRIMKSQDSTYRNEWPSMVIDLRIPLRAVCLLSWTDTMFGFEKQKVGTAFLGFLPGSHKYKHEVALFSSAHNFPDVESIEYSKYDMFFHNENGITTKKEYDDAVKEDKAGGAIHWNLREFLCRFGQGWRPIGVYNEREGDDFIVFMLGTSKKEFEENSGLKTLPASKSYTESPKKVCNIIGHFADGLRWKGENIPLKYSHGFSETCESVLKTLKNHSEKAATNISMIESKKKLFYKSDSLPGCSGSPVLCVTKNEEDEEEELSIVAIHNGTLVRVREVDEDGKTKIFGHSMADILARLELTPRV